MLTPGDDRQPITPQPRNDLSSLSLRRPLSESEDRVLSRWSATLPGREVMLCDWLRAAGSYPDPRDGGGRTEQVLLQLLETVSYRSTGFSLRAHPGKVYEAVYANFDPRLRAELLANSRAFPSPMLHPVEVYAERDGAKMLPAHQCALCGHIGQGLDQKYRGVTPGLIQYRHGDWALISNRFPYNPLEYLWVRVSHDQLERRVNLMQIQDECERRETWPAIPGKTRGAILGSADLSALIAVADKLDLVAHRNHHLDGVTVLHHDHWKLMPSELSGGIWRRLHADVGADRQQASVQYSFSQLTPFDTLVVWSSDRGVLAAATAELLQRLEHAHEIYTVFYYRGAFFVTPRNRALYRDERLNPPTGSTVGFHAGPDCYPQLIDRLERFVTLRGCFDWQRYLSPPGSMPRSSGDDLPRGLAF